MVNLGGGAALFMREKQVFAHKSAAPPLISPPAGAFDTNISKFGFFKQKFKLWSNLKPTEGFGT